jgi:Protein of unknown function (DUF4012)
MFNQKRKIENSKFGISPNFLHSLDGLDMVSAKLDTVRYKINKELKHDKKIISKKRQEFIKPAYAIEKEIIKKLHHQHNKFDKALAESEKKLKKIRRTYWFFNRNKIGKMEKIETQLKWYRSLFSFFIVLILIVVPFKLLASLQLFNVFSLETRVLNSSKSAIDNLMGAGAAASKLDLVTAQNHFANAGSEFLQANDDMAFINDTILSLAALSSNPKIKLASESKKFIKVGILGSNLGSELSQSLFGLKNNNGDWIKLLDDFSVHGHLALNNARELKTEIKKIDKDNLPAEYRSRFEDISSKIEKLPDSLAMIVDNIDELKVFLGSGRDKRYLLIFQNNAEMRGSGGFLGSYALVDFREGKVRNLEVPGGGSYDTEAGLTEKIKAPAPLWLVNSQWHFWDANWWPDFPTTAKNLMWFYEKSGGPTVDGVISFTPSVVEKLLQVTGPIDMTKDYGLIITADNFWQQVELTAERDNIIKNNPEAVAHLPVGETAKPKKIIGDLMAKIMEVLPQKMDKDNLVKLLTISEDSLASKQIMFYFNDANLEKTATERNWGGVMSAAPLDYLMVTNTNIAGAKTDRVIRETIKHHASIATDGSVIDTLTITREHTAGKNEPLVGVRNVDWLRIYVPNGSQLLSASGFVTPDAKYFETPDNSWLDNKFISETEGLATIDSNSGTKIYQENGKTVFANWLMLDPGNTAVISLSYKLPFNIWQAEKKTDFFSRLNNWLNPTNKDLYSYSLSNQKQPGAENETMSTELILPDTAKLIWNSDSSQNSLISNYVLNRDKYYSVLLSNK